MSTEDSNLRYCRQCRKNMPVEDFINRTKNGYCIVCKTCRDRQLKRYYEKKDELDRYPYENDKEDSKDTVFSMPKEEPRKRRCISNNPISAVESLPSSPSTIDEGMYLQTARAVQGKKKVLIPFLIPKYAVLEYGNTCSGVHVAKVIYHRSYMAKQHLVSSVGMERN